MSGHLTFEAVAEAWPGRKWKRRWDWSWPAYEAWFTTRGGDRGPSRAECEAALGRYMPELVPTYRRLCDLAGGGDRAARFLSGWCPPAYLGGCSLAARAGGGEVRLVRNYDLSPDLNEGLLLRSDWVRPVMGMVEFLWGLSDGINDAGLCIALAYGGRGAVGHGFGITTIVRYLLETCETVAEATARLSDLPSHMAYNLVLADATGAVASLELLPGGGVRAMETAIATNHQHGGETAERAGFTRTRERHAHLSGLIRDEVAPGDLARHFLADPLYQRAHDEGFGTLFTAEYDPVGRRFVLLWPDESWAQAIDGFEEGVREIRYDGPRPFPILAAPAPEEAVDWVAHGLAVARHWMAVGGAGAFWPETLDAACHRPADFACPARA